MERVDVEWFFYNGGKFINFLHDKNTSNNKWEEWQPNALYYFEELGRNGTKISLIRDIQHYNTIAPLVELPLNGGEANIDWTGNDRWQPWHSDFRVFRKNGRLPWFHVNSPKGKQIIGHLDIMRQSSCIVSSAIAHTDKSYFNGSGTLIHPYVVLTSAHILENYRQSDPEFDETDLEVTFNYECVAPGTGIEPLSSNRPWAKVLKVLEEGSQMGVDYALLLICWQPSGVIPSWAYSVPPIANRAPIIGEYVTALQNPKGSKVDVVRNKTIYKNPTMVSRGEVFDADEVSGTKQGDRAYAYALYNSEAGSSGGGVYDSEGSLLGVITGGGQFVASFFCQIDKIIQQSKRLQTYLGTSQPTTYPPLGVNMPWPAPLLLEDIMLL